MSGYGIGPKGHPYHRFGDGDQSVVVIPGVMDPLGWNEPSWAGVGLLGRYLFTALRSYDVRVVSRPPGLGPDPSPEKLAEGYGAVLETLGTAHVLGLSFGGFVGLELAKARPELVEKLVLISSGTRYGEYGRETLSRWEEFARREDWAAIHRDYARTVYAGYRRPVVGLLYRLGGRFLPEPVEPGDVSATFRAARAYDGTETAGQVSTPTLLVSGSRDPLVPNQVVTETAAQLDSCRRETLDGGHAIYEESREELGKLVATFLGSATLDP